jgi:tetratricopeptide (TPR) repeat protein
MGQSDLALTDYEKCIAVARNEHGMDCAQMRVDLGNLLCRLKYFREAVYDYRRAIEIDPRLTVAHWYLARALIEQGLWSQALEELNQCSQAGLNDPSIPFMKALALRALNDFNGALQELANFNRTAADKVKKSTLGRQAVILQVQLQQNLQQTQ